MQLLDSCALPQIQFASLSVLVQLRLDDGVGGGSEGGGGGDCDDDDDDPEGPVLRVASSEDLESKPVGSSSDAAEAARRRAPGGGAEAAPIYPEGASVYYKKDDTPATEATVVAVHLDDSSGGPYYTIRLGDGREKQTDDAHLEAEGTSASADDAGDGEGGGEAEGGGASPVVPVDSDDDDDDDDDETNSNARSEPLPARGAEADRSGGPPATRTRDGPPPRKLTRAVLRETATVLSPLTTLPERACEAAMDGLRRKVAEECGMRDDFLGLGTGAGTGDARDFGAGNGRRAGESRGGREEEEEEEKETGESPGGEGVPAGGEIADDGSSSRRSRVRFHDGTKAGAAASDSSPRAAASPPPPPPSADGRWAVRVYRPPRRVAGCSIATTIFYAVARVDDVSKALGEPNEDGDRSDAGGNEGDVGEGDGNRSAEAAGAQLLRGCASALLPRASLPALASDAGRDPTRRAGAVVLAVGVSGPAHDLYGASSVVSSLPDRLRGGLAALAGLDSAPAASRAALCRAVLSSHLDDEDGLVATYDPRLRSSSTTAAVGGAPGSNAPGKQHPRRTRPSGAAGPSESASGGGAGAARRKLFTFSLGKRGGGGGGGGGAADGYERSDSAIPGGGAGPTAGEGEGPSGGASEGPADGDGAGGGGHAEAARRTAQRLELLSLAEDGMALPRYAGALLREGGSGGGRDRRRRRHHRPRFPPSSPPVALRSPRRPGAKGGSAPGGGGGARFGRSPAPSDLSGFERRRPPPGGGVRGTTPRARDASVAGGSEGTDLSSAIASSSPDDSATVATADDSVTVASRRTSDSAAAASSSSSSHHVPTLSRSRRDVSSSSAKTSRKRFLRRKKKGDGDGGGAERATTAGARPPPHHPPARSHQPAYDPFRMSDDDDYDEDRADWMGGAAGEATATTEEAAEATEEAPTTPIAAATARPADSPIALAVAAPAGAAPSSRPVESSPSPDPFPSSPPMVEDEEEEEARSALRSPPQSPPPSPLPPPPPRYSLESASTAASSAAAGDEDEDAVGDGDAPGSSTSWPAPPATPGDPSTPAASLSASGSPHDDGRGPPPPPPLPSTPGGDGDAPPRYSVESSSTAPSPRGSVGAPSSRDDDGGAEEEDAASSLPREEEGGDDAAATARPEGPDLMTAAASKGGRGDAPRDAEKAEPERLRLDVALALNEDLTCAYKRSKLSSVAVEGTVQVRVKSQGPEQPSPAPFFLAFRDPSGHIKALQENKKFVENVTHDGGTLREVAPSNREFTYAVRVPREGEYFPVVRYKCGSALRPVPISIALPITALGADPQRVQSRVRTQGNFCRVALQISSNPQNPFDLAHLTIIMNVPDGVRGDTLETNPPGGVWNEAKRVVLWCVSELGGGEKFQLQSVFELKDAARKGPSDDPTGALEFPVLARCQCAGAQLSDLTMEASDAADLFPADVSTSIVRRFRVSHKEGGSV
ncbi:hypothetical protein ACHAWF_008093 [Thalassiosira exigua]